MNARWPGSALLLAGVLAATAAARGAEAPATPASAAVPAPKYSPLLGMVLGRVVESSVERAGAGAQPGLFKRLGQSLDSVRAEPESGGEDAPADALVPTLGYAMELLDPKTFAVIRPVPVAGSGALLRTGEVFVLQFSTNLPGQVRLENVDPAGQVADLGTYTVLVDQLNRIPRDQGIQLQGRPGQERLRFFFYPCLPREAAGKSWAADFEGRLPPCAGMPAVQMAGAGTAAYGAVTPRALVRLNQPDATMVFAGASSYNPGDVTLLEARIRHDPPAGR
jgi:hypothetical protein